jgi:Protein of unknown function (DUF3137)
MSGDYERIFEEAPDPPKPRAIPPLFDPVPPVTQPQSVDFEAFYRDALLPVLNALETKRLAIREKRKEIFLMGSMVLATSLVAGFCLNLLPLGIGIALAALFIVPAMMPSAKADLRAQYKTGVIGPLIQYALGREAQYVQSGHLDPREFIQTALWPLPPTHYVSEDFIGHRADKTPFYFSEIRATHVYHTGTGKNRREVKIPLFGGVLFRADFNKAFGGRVVVKNKTLGGEMPPGDPIDLPEDPVFNERFAVVSDQDSLKVRYLLTPAFMHRLLELDEQTGRNTEFSLIKDSIYIAFYTEEDHFEIEETSFLDPAQLQKVVERVRRFAGIVEMLELNTRIWTKA